MLKNLMSNSDDSDQKVALVIGASGDIGLACAESLAAVYHPLLHWFKNKKSILQLEQKMGRSFDAYQADITNSGQVEDMVHAILYQYRRIDALIVTSGIGLEPADWSTIDSDIFNKTLDVNLTGIFNCIQKVAPIMIQQKRGSIVVIGSTSGINGSVQSVAYSAGKAGLIAMVKGFAKELAPYQININCISPCWTNTKWHKNKTKEFFQMVKRMIPMKRMIEPLEIAHLVTFLIDADSRMITGQNIVIDGGFSVI